jgi:Protein of unknown function (DUF3052)
MTTTGYSGTPLAKKLGLKPGMTVMVVGFSADYSDLVAPGPGGVRILDQDPVAIAPGSDSAVDVLHLFTNSRDELFRVLDEARGVIKQDGMIWVSWYKKAAKLPTEITEDTIRDAALPMGLVDVKVCAVDEKWSGLKLVIRKELRTS